MRHIFSAFTARRLAVLALLAASMVEAQAQNVSFSSPRDVTLPGSAFHDPANILLIDPNDPRRMLAAHPVLRTDTVGLEWVISTHAYLSLDGGNNWKRVLETDRRSGPFRIPKHADPTGAFTMHGTALIATMFSEDDGDYKGIQVWRSPDGGGNWEDPIDIRYKNVALDRGFMTVDRSSTRHRGRIYLSAIGTDYSADDLVVYSSDDDGKTFQGPFGFSLDTDRRKGSVTQMGAGIVLADGTFLISWVEAWHPNQEKQKPGEVLLKAARTVDGGRTFSKPAVVGKGKLEYFYDKKNAGVGGIYIPILAADTSSGAFNNHVYAAWIEIAGGQQRVLFTSSKDGGITWENSRVIRDAASLGSDSAVAGPHSTSPWIAVTSKGVVGLFYYAQAPGRPGVLPQFIVSLDGGTSWSATHNVTEHPYVPGRGNVVAGVARAWGSPAQAQILRFFAKTTSAHICSVGFVAGEDEKFHMLVIDNHTGDPLVRYVTARVDEQVVVREPITDLVRLEFGPADYNKDKQALSVPVSVRNISQKNILGTIRLVLREPVGHEDARYRVDNADNYRQRGEAWWDFVVSGEDGLLPGERTQSRILRFSNVETDTVRGGYDAAGLAVSMYASLVEQSQVSR